MARPTKLTPEVRELTAKYLSECIENNKVPTAARLAVNIGVGKRTLYDWAKDDTEFSHTLDQLNAIQESTLIDGSLENKLNATISKLMLANHGYKERQDVTTNDEKITNPVSQLTVDELKKLAE
jgi:hypothetical protein